jgi:hypothetical protein
MVETRIGSLTPHTIQINEDPAKAPSQREGERIQNIFSYKQNTNLKYSQIINVISNPSSSAAAETGD